jgi:hypothetical protein
MSAPTPNAALAYQVIDHIDAHPEQWHQGTWVGQADCGTIACFAGWAVLLSGYQVDEDGDVSVSPSGSATDLYGEHVQEAADVLLGIGKREVEAYGDLYDGLLTRYELGCMVEEIFGPRPAVTE